jgi:asparagine synthase (glutamine-hydrolysing)
VPAVGDRHRLGPVKQGFAERVDMSWQAQVCGGVYVLGCRVWWRGFLANRSALVDELGHHGDVSYPDESLIAAAYRRWGADLQAHLIGEYALAVLDQAAGSLVLTHDAVGVVPLYYSAQGQTIYFGSHLSLIAKLIPGVGFDESYIAEFLSRGDCFGEHTIYRDVRRLGVGRTMRYTRRGGTELQTWRPDEIPELRYRDPCDYEEHFRELIRSAVTTAVEGRTWSELSGGLDSSTIACVANDLDVEDFQTVSIIYPKSTTADEASWIKIVHAEKRFRGHLIDGDKHKPFSVLPDRAIDEPSRLHFAWPLFCEYERILQANGVDVLLSGLGGDQVLFGEINYPIHVADEVRSLRLISAARHVAKWGATAGERSLTHRMLSTAVIPAYSYLRGRAIHYEHDRAVPPVCAWVSPDLLRRNGVGDRPLRAPIPRLPTVRGQAYYEHIWRMACTAGRTWGQNTDAYRWRYPLRYRPLVEFMYSLPWQQQVTCGQTRTLQRRALTGVLPEQTRTRRTKSGPDQAVYEGLRTNPDAFELLTVRPLIAQLGYVDETAWQTAVRAAQFGFVRSIAAFDAAVSLEIWLRQQENQQ